MPYALHVAAWRNHQTEIALNMIFAALYPACELGWNEWSAAAARGEWS